MNFKTTITLLILVLACGVILLVDFLRKPSAVTDESLQTLEAIEKKIKDQEAGRIEVSRGERRLVLERTPAGTWGLPGNWPVRDKEVKELVEVLANLKSRFTPVAISGAGDLKQYGLDPSREPLQVIIKTADQEYQLKFGEKPEGANRFIRPTILRINDSKDVILLAPNLLASLDRPVDYYQQRRLFPGEAAKDTDTQDMAERLQAKGLQVKGKDAHFTMNLAGTDWELAEPVKDRPDPDKLKSLLAAVPDIWAEQFVDRPKKDLEEYGLKTPEQTITVTSPNGETVSLLIGKKAETKTRTITRPPPPGGPPGMPRMPQQETLHEDYLFAKLDKNDQIFEIKADKIKDVFVGLDMLRDARLARFKSEDARKVEIKYGGQEVVLAKEKDSWRLQKPIEGDAETTKVSELVDKLANLQAKDKDVMDKADLKANQLDPPAGTVQITVEESKGEGENKTKTTKTFTYLLGKNDIEKSKLSIQVQGWPRVNVVDDAVLKLVNRPALAYKGRRVLDFFANDLTKIEVQRGDEKYAFQQEKDNWKLTSPIQVEVDATKMNKLVDDMGRLEAAEYVNTNPQPDDLDKEYGLAKPGFSATFTFSKADKPAQTILIGKQRADKPEYFAKIASAPGVFVVKKEIRDLLDQGSLAYRSLNLWHLKAEDVVELRHQRADQEYRLKKEDAGWKVVEPFEAATMGSLVQPMVNDLANLTAEKYEAHVAKELGAYGLDKPALRVVLTTTEKPKDQPKDPEKPKEEEKAKDDAKPKEPEKPKETTKTRVLLIGKPTAEGAKSRFAKLGDGEAIFVVGEKLLANVDRNALDLLERKLLTLEINAFNKIQSQAGNETMTLQKDKDTWQVEARMAKFPADKEVINGMLSIWADLQANKFAAFGPKVDWAAFGLDRPERTITVSLTPPAETDDKKPAKSEHTVSLGKAVPDETGLVYARVDDNPGVAVLGPGVVSELKRGYLDFAERTVFQFSAGAVNALERKMGKDELQVTKGADGWQLVKPNAMKADTQTLDGLVEELASLRAQKIAAYQPQDLKPFGVDAPAALVTLKIPGADGQSVQHVLRIGKTVAADSQDRYVQAEGSKAVAVISGTLAGKLLALPLKFRDRSLVRFTDVDRVQMERAARKLVFNKVAGTWKMTSPVDNEAEQSDLEDFINNLAKLRADELVADQPADLKPYGLDKPEVRWRLQAGGKDVLELWVGSSEKDPKIQSTNGPRHYAKLTSGALVFLMDSKLASRATGEYRSRTVWGPLDAVQVESLRYHYSGNSFTLEKKDNTWSVVGKPELKPVSETVSETLDALARLKALRFVVDKDPDLKLYGLEPPQLELEVISQNGRRALHVGRTEGDSKRYYAKAWEGNHNAVFLISEEDAALIVRDVQAFTKPPSKPAPPKGPSTIPKPPMGSGG